MNGKENRCCRNQFDETVGTQKARSETLLACHAANNATEHSTNIQASVTTCEDKIVLCDLPIELAIDAMDAFLPSRLTDE